MTLIFRADLSAAAISTRGMDLTLGFHPRPGWPSGPRASPTEWRSRRATPAFGALTTRRTESAASVPVSAPWPVRTVAFALVQRPPRPPSIRRRRDRDPYSARAGPGSRTRWICASTKKCRHARFSNIRTSGAIRCLAFPHRYYVPLAGGQHRLPLILGILFQDVWVHADPRRRAAAGVEAITSPLHQLARPHVGKPAYTDDNIALAPSRGHHLSRGLTHNLPPYLHARLLATALRPVAV